MARPSLDLAILYWVSRRRGGHGLALRSGEAPRWLREIRREARAETEERRRSCVLLGLWDSPRPIGVRQPRAGCAGISLYRVRRFGADARIQAAENDFQVLLKNIRLVSGHVDPLLVS